ncbi:hypothetical protein RZN25_13660 [Bacillaceae bacterium S4-13-56]
MKRILILIFFLIGVFPSSILASEEKIAFVRDGNVYLLHGKKELQITEGGNAFSPQWSSNGRKLSYSTHEGEQTGLWVYDIESKEKKQVFYDAYQPLWAPSSDHIAFLQHSVLDISDLNGFSNVSLGVDSYTWHPSGEGFILSSAANILPTGWTTPILYKKKIAKPFADIKLFENVEPLFTIPHKVGGKEKDAVLAISASHLTFSPSRKWLSFLVSPTASWAMDQNKVCVLGENGDQFQVLGDVIHQVGAPKWAPTKDILAFIEGQGRIVYGFKDKKLSVKEMPATGTLTPDPFSDLDFDWIDDSSLVTSRVEEREWSNDPKEHPLPKLYTVDILSGKNKQITDPPRGHGDYSPQYAASLNKIIWFRGKSIMDRERDVWMADIDGENSRLWLEDVEEISIYED